MRPFFLRTLPGLLLLALYIPVSAPAASGTADSLLNLLPQTSDAAARHQIYIRLADMHADSLALAATYWEKALGEAHRAGDTYGCKDVLDILVRKFAGRDTLRTQRFIRQADSLLPGREHTLFRASLHAYYIWKQMSDNNSIETVARELAKLKDGNGDGLTPEEQIKWEFLTGLSTDFSSIAAEAYDNIHAAIPYVERALQKLGKYPQEQRLHFEKLCHDELSDLYMLTHDKRAAAEIEKCIALHRKWLAMDKRFDRPDRDTTTYLMHAYAKMVFLRDLISKEKATEYYEKCMRLARAKGDLGEIYSTSARYYQHMGDKQRAVAYIDSTINNYRLTNNKSDLAPIYATQSYLYEEMGDYKNALEAIRNANRHRFDDRVKKAQSNLAEMQALFNVNQLELEKAQLDNRNKFVMLVTGGIVLLLLVGWSIYQHIMVRRLKQTRRQLLAANEEVSHQSRRAMESEKMKTAFINSICHEIRTPLNAISGFSELLLEDSHDEQARSGFRKEIWENTTALTRQLENMLELSKLVSTEEPLPCVETDVCALCRERLLLQKGLSDNPSVAYIMDDKGGGCTVPTNPFYLTRVIDNLLQNAAKFTSSGSITLTCRNDEQQRALHISVSDTGIGIPPEKQEWVFDRFTKVDPFKPGSGIGLYFCRLIVTRLGGDIRICPEYREGCCILITLPY